MANILEEFEKLTPKEQELLSKHLQQANPPRNKTYFQEKYALQLLPDLKQLVEKDCVLFYPYEEYPQWKPATLYLYLNDAFLYISTNLDDDKGTMKDLRATCEVAKGKKGVIIRRKMKAANVTLTAHILTEDPDAIPLPSKWKAELYTWIEDSEQSTAFIRKELQLSQDDVEELTNLFSDDNEDFGLFIAQDKTSFKVVKLKTQTK